jgi:GGDEF domain-containing protein
MRQCDPSFVGHIGGDDFVFILPVDAIEEACRSIISDFDAIVPSFYDPKDRVHGCILSRDRKGHEQIFPILSISIAVVRNIDARFECYAELAHAAGQLKCITKATQGSVYVIDRRK